MSASRGPVAIVGNECRFAGGIAELRALEACILDHPSVHDCVLRRRTGPQGEAVIVAYVVALGGLTLEGLGQLARAAGSTLLPTAMVRVSSIPLRDDGSIDEALLASSPVIDAPTIERYAALIGSAEGVADVEIVSEWHPPGDPGLPIDELLPQGSRSLRERAPPGGPPTALDPDAPPSLSLGGPIDFGARPPSHLAALLARAADLQPAHGVTCIEHDGEHVLTYPELRDRAERIMAGLRAAGLRPGDAVIFQFERNPDFIAAFWGCVLGGFVPAPISVPTVPDPASPAAAKLKNVWQLLGGPLVLTSAGLEPGLLRLRTLLELPDLRLVTIERLRQSPAGEAWHQAAPDDLALLLLTSGSTGLPKAVTQTHGALLAAAAAMAQRNGFSASDVCMNWISLDHVGGIVMCHLMFVALGCRQVHARTDYVLQDVLRWLDLIDRYRATFTWAPNFAFALVNDRVDEVAARRWNLSSMGFVLNGGEAVVAQTARRFLRLLAPHGLPATAMHPAWGMSETSSAATFSLPFLFDSTSDSNELVGVGPPNPGFEIRIVDDRGNVVPEGCEGRLEVRGLMVTRGYLNNPEANAEAFTADGWFRTGDLGKLSQGRLTITGREKGIIIINGVNYYAHEVEAAVEDVAGVTPSFSAAFAVREPGADTDALVIAFHTPQQEDTAVADLLRRIRSAALERVGIVPRYLLPVSQDDIPKTSIGKIQRSALTKRFEQGGFSAVVKRVEQLTQRGETLPDWFYRPIWRKRLLASQRPVGRGCLVLLLADRSGIAAAFERAVHETGARCVRFDPHDAGGLQRLIAETPAEERLVIVHGGGYGRRPGTDESDQPAIGFAAAESIVGLVQGLARSKRSPAPCEILVYDDRVQHVVPGDQLVCAKATGLGMLRTVSQEHREISVRHADLPEAEPEVLARLLLAELADRSDEPEVAYRGSERWVRRLARRPPYPSGRGHGLGRTDGFYLVTGGLGGIGTEICRHLLRTAEVPLLLVGRRPVVSGSDEHHVTLASLQALGTVHYEALDVANKDSLERAVASAAERWGRSLGGVIHLAGVFEPRLLTAETSETLAAALSAKVHGAWNIHRLLLRHPDAVLIAFSSVNGYLGGAAAGAYAAANAFLDSLVQHQVLELGRTAYSLGWSLWDAVGMSRNLALKDPARRRGYCAVSLQQGLLSLLATAGSEPGHVLIGLDGANPHIRRHLAEGVLSDGVTAYWMRARDAGALVLPPLEDQFGAPVPCRTREVLELASLRGSARHRARPESSGAGPAEPSFGNDLERAIAAVWREVLPPGEIGPNDNFFDVGGNSLLVATASRKLQQALGREVPMTDIYRFPTLRLLAGHYGGGDEADAIGLHDSEGRGQARRTKRLQRRRRNP